MQTRFVAVWVSVALSVLSLTFASISWPMENEAANADTMDAAPVAPSEIQDIRPELTEALEDMPPPSNPEGMAGVQDPMAPSTEVQAEAQSQQE